MKKNLNNQRLLSGLFFRLLPYQILLLIVSAANGITDSLFASNIIGKTGMTAIGLFAPLTHFLFAVSIILVSGSQLLVGESLGKNDPDSAEKYFSTDLVISVVISLIVTIILTASAVTDITRLFVSGMAERQSLNLYILGQVIGIPSLVLGQQLFAFLSIENKTFWTTIASLTCILSNALMNALLVGVMSLGIFGLGLASSISFWLFFLTMAACFISGRSGFRFSLSSLDTKLIPSIFIKGCSGGISRFLEMFRCFIINLLILKYVGEDGISAFAAVNSGLGLLWPVPFAMQAVCRMMLGISIGEEDRSSLKGIMKVCISRGFLLQCAITAIVVIFAEPITTLFYHNPSDPVFHMTMMGFRILTLCMPLSVLAGLPLIYSQAMDIRLLSILLPILNGAVNVVFFSILLIPRLLMNGLYIANILNGLVCVSLIISYVLLKNGHFPKSFDELLLIPDTFGAAEENRLDIEIEDPKDVVKVSEEVIDFCRMKGIEKRRAFFSGLALEEMAGNIVRYGYTADKRIHTISLRVIIKDGDVILRLRDDCREFDPLKRAEILWQSEDRISNIGIRLVYTLSNQFIYNNLLGLNVLTLRI